MNNRLYCVVIVVILSILVTYSFISRPISISPLSEPVSSVKRSIAPSSKCRKIMWFMGVGSVNAAIEQLYWDFMVAAIQSAKQNAPSLIPHVIHNEPLSVLPSSLTKIPGVVFVQHNLSFQESLNKSNFGVYYRMDIPLVVKKLLPTMNSTEVDPDYALYTDSDVLFFNDFNECTLPKPKVVHIGPDWTKGKIGNSGVLFMNVSAWGHHLPSLIKMGEAKQWNYEYCDQGLIMKYFVEGRLASFMPDRYNYKGYWGNYGVTHNITIAHFHAPKPRHCLECALMYRGDFKRCIPAQCHTTYENFLKRALKSDGMKLYEDMVYTFKKYSEPS